ncbi:DUF4142 domain-containing protein [Allokutzneria oryzae]|uniref:DUF4142 domain-containing protein n=1 Tax=Allokutzneria oryzae TaxID=1378989 RepID=A0ABV6A3I5_9PSEU
MKPLHFLAATGVAGALVLTGTTITQAATVPESGPLASAVIQPESSRMDRSFLMQAHQGNRFEISAGLLAMHKARCSTVRRLGAEFARDHRKMDAKLRLVSTRERVALPGTMTRAQQVLLRQLAKRSGTAFDRSWLRAQVKAHEQVLALIHQQVRHGYSHEVKQLARGAAPIVLHHLNMARTALRTC